MNKASGIKISEKILSNYKLTLLQLYENLTEVEFNLITDRIYLQINERRGQNFHQDEKST